MPYKRGFSAQEFARLQRGLMPEAMEDKWFIVWQDDALYCHRSWTGLCVFRLRFDRDGERYAVCEALVNRDPAQHGGVDTHDLNLLGTLIEGFLRFAERFR